MLQRHAEIQERATLVWRLDAFADHPDAEACAQVGKMADDELSLTALSDASDEPDVEFYRIRLKVGKQVHPCIPGAEVIDGGEEAMNGVRCQNTHEMVVIDYLLVLGDFEDNPIERPMCCFRRCQGFLKAMLRIVDGVRQKVNRQ